MRRARLRAALVLVALLALAPAMLPATPAAGSRGKSPKFTAWLAPASSITYDQTGSVCIINARVGMQEHGKHSIDGFKWRMGAYDSEAAIGQETLSGVRHRWNWWKTTTFPNDHLSYRYVAHLPGAGQRVAATSGGLKPSFVIRVKAVGVRSSFWKADFKRWVTVGSCSYTDGYTASDPSA